MNIALVRVRTNLRSPVIKDFQGKGRETNKQIFEQITVKII